jgi:hypothetical protein
MNDKELDRLLKFASPPKWSDAHWETFPERITAALRWGSKSIPQRAGIISRENLRPLSWGFALTAVCGVIALAIGLWCIRVSKSQQTLDSDNIASAKLIREMLAMFPNRVRTIVSDEHGLNVELSDHEDIPVSPPLYVHICDGRQCSSFVTFSGQEIQAAGERITVLSDGQGGVILTSDQFVWSNEDHIHGANRLSIEARNLDKVM